jgi:hypothetical protein
MKNKNILLKDLLLQREAELITEAVRRRLTPEEAAEKMKQLRDKAKQEAGDAIVKGTKKAKEIAVAIQDDPRYQKLRDELQDELKDPQRTREVINKSATILTKIGEVLNSQLSDKEKRAFLKKYMASNTAIFIGVAAKLWDIIRGGVRMATDVSFDMPEFLGGDTIGNPGGVNLEDPWWLDTMGDLLPYMIGLRTLITIYAAKDLIKKAKNFGKKDDISESLNETNEFFNSEDVAALMKAIDISLKLK